MQRLKCQAQWSHDNIFLCSSFLVDKAFKDLITKPESWPERNALEDFTNRRLELVKRRDKINGVLTETPLEGGYCWNCDMYVVVTHRTSL